MVTHDFENALKNVDAHVVDKLEYAHWPHQKILCHAIHHIDRRRIAELALEPIDLGHRIQTVAHEMAVTDESGNIIRRHEFLS